MDTKKFYTKLGFSSETYLQNVLSLGIQHSSGNGLLLLVMGMNIKNYQLVIHCQFLIYVSQQEMVILIILLKLLISLIIIYYLSKLLKDLLIHIIMENYAYSVQVYESLFQWSFIPRNTYTFDDNFDHILPVLFNSILIGFLSDTEGENQGDRADEGAAILSLSNNTLNIELSWAKSHIYDLYFLTIGY